MTSPIKTDLYDTIANVMEQTSFRSRLERVWLGGTSGPNGGEGTRPGGFIGQLNQPYVSYDETEAETLEGSGSLLDNLNHIRWRIATLSGMTSSGTVNIGEYDYDPLYSGIATILFSGAIVSSIDPDTVLVTVSGLTVRELDEAPTIADVHLITFDGFSLTNPSVGEVKVSNVLTFDQGEYTPTLTDVANLDSSTAYDCQYMRIGDVVHVSGKVDVDPTLTTTSTQLGISLPIASNFSAEEDCAGTAFCPAIAGQGAAILADTSNDRAQMQWISADVTEQSMFFTFTYKII